MVLGWTIDSFACHEDWLTQVLLSHEICETVKLLTHKHRKHRRSDWLSRDVSVQRHPRSGWMRPKVAFESSKSRIRCDRCFQGARSY